MKRLLTPFRLITLAALLSVAALPVMAQTYEGCDDQLTITGSSGRTWNCYIDSADAEWCYYWCYSS